MKLKIFISKICKYKQGQKYENINIFFPFCKNIWDVKACGAWLSKDKSCANWVLKKKKRSHEMKNGLCVPGCVLYHFRPEKEVIVAYLYY